MSALVSLKMSDALKGGAKTGNTIHYTEMHTQCPLCILSFCAKFSFKIFVVCIILFFNSLKSSGMEQLSWEYGTSWEEEEEMFDNLNSE